MGDIQPIFLHNQNKHAFVDVLMSLANNNQSLWNKNKEKAHKT